MGAANDVAVIKTDLLIVGAGPAGASLACFLASYGRTGTIISAAPGCANTPRAHITNAAGLECLRDIDLDQECLAACTDGDNMRHTRWCRSMAGDEWARAYSWGNDPHRKGDYEAASPCSHVDLPQTELEPILTRRAVHRGWTLRFNTTMVKFERPGPADEIISTVRDEVSKQEYKIQSKYLFGCDGARSVIVQQLDIPLIKKPGQGVALNLLVKADMTHLIEHRPGNLHWVFLPDKPYPPWCWTGLVRMVKPWSEWMFICLPKPGVDLETAQMTGTNEEYVARAKEMIGDDSVKVEVLNASKWWINETVAEYYSDGNIFCFGDATHRHPPFNGLGSNTCIQDAFNLAWKIHYVMSGQASPKLLDSFSKERQPVGQGVITRANQGLRDHMMWYEASGMMEDDLEKRQQILAEFDDQGEIGRKRRAAFKKGVENTSSEFHGLGVEMNQRYESGAVYTGDESSPMPPMPDDAVKQHQISTYPGCRLPHAWLNSRSPGKQYSTIDIAGHGAFCLLTGPGGQEWKTAAERIAKKLNVTINSHSIGWKQDHEDVYYDWEKRREVDETGCILVRPDRFVAWRSQTLISDCDAKLENVMRCILGLEGK